MDRFQRDQRFFNRTHLMLRTGSQSPEFTLTDLAGRQLTREETMQNARALLLIFLRHLG